MRYWVKIQHASKKENGMVIGIACVNGVVLSTPFVSFWIELMQEWSGMPTHYIDMPDFRPDEDW